MDHAPQSEEQIFAAAAALAAERQGTFLDAACGGDLPRRARIERRLAEAREGGGKTQSNDEIGAALALLGPESQDEWIGPYKLRERIGEGGCGTVWVAEQEEPVRRRVALKIIKPGMETKEGIARFEQERQALAMMDHPNIAKVFDAGTTDTGRPFFVMELVRGIQITDYCDQANVATRERLQLFISVCHAVQHAHQKGIIHRDLKPSNILVALHDGVPVPKVIDFGVAKATHQQRLAKMTVYTQLQQMIGTPVYMSPEQAEMSGLDIDTRSDIYSLGVVLYELLTGRTPFGAENLHRVSFDEMRRIIREDEPPRPSVAVGTLSSEKVTELARNQRADRSSLLGILRGDLDWIVVKAIEKDRTRRYETANALAMDIARHLASEPVLARPPTRLYRFRRFTKRNRAIFLSGSAIAAALVIGAIISVWQAVRAEHEARRANGILAQLRSTAPAFAAQARELVVAENFDEAITKLNYAIQLRPDSADYLRERAWLLQSRLRLPEAAADFRTLLTLEPGDASARRHGELCERLAGGSPAPAGGLPRASLAELYAAMSAERRPAAQLMPLARVLGRDGELMRQYWLDRLRSLPNASGLPLAERLKTDDHGTLDLVLSGTNVSDLSPLREMPLGSLDLTGCPDVRTIDALKGMPLRRLDLTRTGVGSLAPLAGMRTLEELTLGETPVADLSPLHALPLRKLRLPRTDVTDLSPLHEMPLTHLECGHTRVADLSPLIGLPLRMLELSYTPVENFAPLAGLPLEYLGAQGVRLGDLAFTRQLPLQALVVTGARELRNVRVLREIPTLEALVLPGSPLDLAEDELDGIESLKSHPGLLRISTTLPEGSNADSAEPAPAFWRKWDSTMRWWRALRKAGITARASLLPDGTWMVSAHGQPLRDLGMFAGSEVSVLDVTACSEIRDLSPLRGLPLMTLSIGHTGVIDLSPLKGMALRSLWMAGTKVTDLSPLRGLPLTTLYMDQCPNLRDLTPLREIPTLEAILLPENALDVGELRGLQNLRRISYTFDTKIMQPASPAADFWKAHRDLAWLRALRTRAGAIAAAQIADGTWRVSVKDPQFSDLTVLGDAQISGLALCGSGVTDLQPLASLPLRTLRLDGSAVTDVSALALIPSLESVVLPRGCTGIARLHDLPLLKRVAFDVNADGAPALEAAAFWAAQDRPAR